MRNSERERFTEKRRIRMNEEQRSKSNYTKMRMNAGKVTNEKYMNDKDQIKEIKSTNHLETTNSRERIRNNKTERTINNPWDETKRTRNIPMKRTRNNEGDKTKVKEQMTKNEGGWTNQK